MTKEASSTTLTRAPERARPGGGFPRPGRAVLEGTNSGDSTPTGPDRSGRRPVERGASGASLPLAVDSFLGRDDDMRGITDLFARGRLVTITGAPGMGKTRLATEIARSAPKDRYPNGRWLVPLASVSSFELVAPALAKVMGVPEQGQADIVASLVRQIGDAHLLIMLDNCEHVLDACARLAAALVESCSNLHFLATSQERLDVPGEQVWALGGLDVPAGTTVSRRALAASPAVRLFVERARWAHRHFELTPDVAGPVVDICRRLDGIPLAIELAAGRVGSMAPAEIAARLDERFTLLTGGARTVLPRHHTLKAAVDWSYDLLTDEEQAILRRLSVFAGGATLDSVERVCAGEPVGSERAVEVVTHLVARSLVAADSSGPLTRYRLLETIRFYGRDRMREAGEANTTAARHLDWCIELAERAEARLTGPEQVQALARLEAEHDNLRAALAHSFDQGPPERALRLAASLALFWRIRGHFAEGKRTLGQAIDAIEMSGVSAMSGMSEAASAALRAKGLWGYSLLAAVVGDWNRSVRAARQALGHYRQLDDLSGVARSHLLLGAVPYAGDPSVGVGHLRQSIALARRVADQWCLAYALALCGAALGRAGDPMARPMLEEAVAVASEAGDPEAQRYARISLGGALLTAGELVDARALLEQVLADGPPVNPYERATVHLNLARIALAQGDLGRAREALEVLPADVRLSPSADTWIEGLQLAGHLHLAGRDVESAAACFEQAREACVSAQFHVNRPNVGLGEVALARGEHERARQLFDDAREESDSPDAKRMNADAFDGLARVALVTGDAGSAADLSRRAVVLRLGLDDRIGLAATLEIRACAEARSGRPARAIRLLAAVVADREAGAYVPRPSAGTDPEAVITAARESLGDEAFDQAWAQGTATTLKEAATTGLARRGPPRRDRPTSGAESLTESELAVTRLVIEGLSNPEVAARLFLSPYTVKTHVSRVYAKLGVASRRELRDRFKDVEF